MLCTMYNALFKLLSQISNKPLIFGHFYGVQHQSASETPTNFFLAAFL